jgi:ADP-ribose pyrophosphatase YjhB (NUDIX family)
MIDGVTVWTVVVNPADKKTLLIQRAEDSTWGCLWAAAGGKVEESDFTKELEYSFLEKSAIREVKEETNIDVTISNYVCSFARNVKENNIGKIVIVAYVAVPTTYDVQPQLEEVERAKWFTFDEAIDLPLVDGMPEILQQVFREQMWETA